MHLNSVSASSLSAKIAMKRFSCSVKCSECSREYKTSRATLRHMLKSHGLQPSSVDFFDAKGQIVDIRNPTTLPKDSTALVNYKEWLLSLTERVNEALHPALQGR